MRAVLAPVDSDGSNLERLTFGGGDQPAWSPDGTKIAFVRAGTVWVMNGDGSGQHTLGVSGTNPAWSNDGSRIAIDGVSVMNADGAGLDFLTSASSPHGRRMARRSCSRAPSTTRARGSSSLPY